MAGVLVVVAHLLDATLLTSDLEVPLKLGLLDPELLGDVSAGELLLGSSFAAPTSWSSVIVFASGSDAQYDRTTTPADGQVERVRRRGEAVDPAVS